MNYSYVKPNGTSYEFISDNGHEHNGVVYSQQFLNASSNEFIASIGLFRTSMLPVPTNAKTTDGTMYFNKVGNIVEYRPNYILYTQAEQVANAVQYFTDYTTKYIESKVQAYNSANGLAFKDIDAFTKYAVVTSSVHNAIALKFIAYASNVWLKARAYQAERVALSTAPADAEFKAVLDSVVF